MNAEVIHPRVTARAFEQLVAALQSYGNRPNEQHRAALHALVGTMAAMALGLLQGRYAVGLPTSMGKTTAILCVLESLSHNGVAEDCPLIVSGQRVEALREHVAKLVAMGVPREMLGLVYKFEPERDGREKPDADHADRPFLFATHSRVRRSFDDLEPYLRYRDRRRGAMYYDESLMRTDAVGLALRDLRPAIRHLEAIVEEGDGRNPRSRDAVREATGLLVEALALVTGALKKSKADPKHPATVKLPAIRPGREGAYRCALENVKAKDEVIAFLGLFGAEVRVVTTEQGGVVQFRRLVPDELHSVLVLDASYPIRTLQKLDATLQDAEKRVPAFKRLGFALSATKDWRRVTFHQLRQGGGRSTLRGMFGQPREDNWLADEIIKVVKSRPPDEAWVFVTYKRRPYEKRAMVDALRDDLEKAGIDTTSLTPAGHPRFSFVTWGTHDASNAYRHAQNLVLVGVMQRDKVELHAAALGQMDLLGGLVTSDALKQLHRDELTHLVFQAASRGASRTVTDGVAGESRVWFVEKNGDVSKRLARVCPGATFLPWEVDPPTATTVALTAEAIREALQKMEAKGVERASVREVRSLARLHKTAKRTLSRAITLAISDGSWRRERQSLVRVTGAFFGFVDERPANLW
jgi:hypothetical protein